MTDAFLDFIRECIEDTINDGDSALHECGALMVWSEGKQGVACSDPGCDISRAGG